MKNMDNIWKLYAIRFFHSLVPAYVIERLFWEQRGMTIQMVVYTEIIYAITIQSFEKVLGRLNVFDFASAIIAALCGSLLASRFDFELNYWISLISMLVSLCLTLMLVEPAVKSNTDESMEIKEYVRASLFFFRKRRGVSLVLFGYRTLLSGVTAVIAAGFIYQLRREDTHFKRRKELSGR